MASSSQATKRGRLSAVVGTKFVSKSALADIFKRVLDSNIDIEHASRRTQSRALEADMNPHTIYGYVLTSLSLPLSAGGFWSWGGVTDLQALLSF